MRTQKERLSDTFKNNSQLFIYESPEGRAIFRLLTLEEYRVAEKLSRECPATLPSIEEEVWDMCIIEQTYDPEIDRLNAGIISTVAQLILRLSTAQDLSGVEREVVKARIEASKTREMLILKVCEGFPSYTPEQVEKFDWPTLAMRVAQSEMITGKIIDFEKSDGKIQGKEQKKGAITDVNEAIKAMEGHG